MTDAVDLYRPEGTARTGAILLVPGGSTTPELCRRYGSAVADRGVVGAVVGRSLIGVVQPADASDEVEVAIGALRSDPRVDPARVGLWFFADAGLLAGEWLDSRPEWLRFVALSNPLLGAGELVSAAEVIGKPGRGGGAGNVSSQVLPVLLIRGGDERDQLAGPVAEFVSAGGTALDIIDGPKGQHGFDMLDHDEESRAAVTAALDWAIAHLGEDPDNPTTPPTLPRPTQAKSPVASLTATGARAGQVPGARQIPGAGPALLEVRSGGDQSGTATHLGAEQGTAPGAAAGSLLEAGDKVSGETGALGVAGLAGLGSVAADTAAARVVGREHSAAAANDLEACLSLYSPTAQVELPDGTTLKGRRFLREHFRLRFEAGRGKIDVVQRMNLGNWVVEHAISSEESGPTPTIAIYRVEDTHITEVRYLT